MTVRAVVWRSFYRDSVALMRLASRLRSLPGVADAAALMGTPANRDLLAQAGLAASPTEDAAPDDLMLAVRADDVATADAALVAAKALVDERAPGAPAARRRPRTLDSALREMADADVALISVPGEYAVLEASHAIRRGLHVFLFSDNVSLEDEVTLKRLAVRRRRLCMGPDCGTAYLNGIGLGFANVVPRGRIGCVAASGTGLQTVASRLAAAGEGISQGIGVGGRDLSDAVGGAMALFALDALAADAATELVVLLSKPASPEVTGRIERALPAIGKPVVVCCLGTRAHEAGPVHWVDTLDEAADRAVALVRERAWSPRTFADPARVATRLSALRPDARRLPGRLLGLYTGGTLAGEARLVLEPLLGAVRLGAGSGSAPDTHRLLDLGADEFTVGRPHPMLDPRDRAERVRAAGHDATVGVILLDLVLGRSAHENPAEPLAAAIRDARAAAAAAARPLFVVASVVGTDRDPQGVRAQVRALEAAGTEVLPSNAEAARFGGLLVEPALAGRLLGRP